MSVDLFVVRHAIAFERDETQLPDDSLRPLTPEGERAFERAAGGRRGAAGGAKLRGLLPPKVLRALDA